ncbi:sialate O-acetylesterase [Pedobacter sp. MC2016-14]|uniref:sialate O-acetylesterase n=1 Tax=Pedobacter sp. MC2016-14 TaxID=2897327 RepID=UPI001E30755D|nr:sialate O-acetylesterase [Pedobacter sp. MC2016-14]MCD0488827.1 sialate O-acetylesterase [Pedobacter sp. MC2016-14]
MSIVIGKAMQLLMGMVISLNVQNSFSQQRTDTVYHIVMYGQSLMLGTGSVPLLSVQQQYNTLMFSGGIRSGYDADADYYAGLVPLTEKIVISKASGAKLGETPATGFSEEFNSLLGSAWSNTLLLSSPAQGSTSIAALTGQGIYWDRFKKDIIEASRLVFARGKKYNVPFILWNQGEKDIDGKTSADSYKNDMKWFQQKADEFIKSVTGQTNAVKILMYQTVSHNVRKAMGNPEIANAQYELAKSEANITISNTTYQLPYLKDNVHLTNVGSKWNGADHAIAAKALLIDKVNWKPIYVKGISSSKNVIVVDFHVPVPPIVFDEINVSNPGNYGFRIFNKSGKELAIKDVYIKNGDKVYISTEEEMKKGGILWYGNNGIATGALNGARGNLRDTQGDKFTIEIAGKRIRLDNWCPVFKEEIPE